MIATFLASECVPQKTGETDEHEKAELAMSTAETYFGIIIQVVKRLLKIVRTVGKTLPS